MAKKVYIADIKNPSLTRAIRTLSKTYDVCLVDTNKTDYIEELKGKKLKRPQ